MSTLSSSIKLALFVVVTVLATGLLAMTIANSDFRSKVSYSAIFTDAAALNGGDEVRLAGVRVGDVAGIELHEGKYAKVTFKVDKEVPVTTATRIVIRYRNLIGQRYIALVDEAGDGEVVEPGTVIPESRTQPALNLNALFNGFRPLLAGLDPEQINQLSYELITVLQGEGGTVNSLMARIGSLTGTLADRDELIGQVIDNLNAVLGPINERDQQLSAMIANLQSFVSGLSADRQAIGDSLVGINALADTTASLVRDARPSLQKDIQHLGVLAAKLDTKASKDLLYEWITYTPFKMQVASPETSYGAFLNFYACAANFILPDGSTGPLHINDAKRCNPE